MNKNTVILVGFFLLGLSLCAASLMFYNETNNFLKTSERTSGTVVELRPHRSSKRGLTYNPVVEFTVNGKTEQFESNASSSPPSYEVGDKVEIFYDPSNPVKAKINGIFDLWGSSLILGVFGVIHALTTAAIVFRKRRKQTA